METKSRMSKRVPVKSTVNEIPTSIKTCLTKHEYGKKVIKEMLPDANEIPSGSKYVLHEQIGEGAQGAVFVGFQISECGIRKKVAIKVLKKNYGEKEIKRLVKEAKILELLTQGNIAEMLALESLPYDPAIGHKTYILIQELIEGLSLEKLLILHRNKNLLMNPTMIAFILYKAALALDEAHNLKSKTGKPLKVVHRSLSPSNILINEKAGIVKLSDFGMAAIDDEELGAGALKGKPQYMAPEQFLGNNFISTDIWSLGVIAYEALTGFLPYQISGETLNDATDRFVTQSHFTLRSPAEILNTSKLSKEFHVVSDLIMKCLNPNGHRRPTADQIQHEIASKFLYKEGLGATNRTLSAYVNLIKNLPASFQGEDFPFNEELGLVLKRTLHVKSPYLAVSQRISKSFDVQFLLAIKDKHRNPCLKITNGVKYE